MAAGSQTYVLVAGGLRLCPVDVALGRGIFAGPCAGMQAGVHRGTSAGVPNARDQDKPWLSPLGTAHALFPVAERLTVELANRASAQPKTQSPDQLPKIEGKPIAN